MNGEKERANWVPSIELAVWFSLSMLSNPLGYTLSRWLRGERHIADAICGMPFCYGYVFSVTTAVFCVVWMYVLLRRKAVCIHPRSHPWRCWLLVVFLFIVPIGIFTNLVAIMIALTFCSILFSVWLIDKTYPWKKFRSEKAMDSEVRQKVLLMYHRESLAALTAAVVWFIILFGYFYLGFARTYLAQRYPTNRTELMGWLYIMSASVVGGYLGFVCIPLFRRMEEARNNYIKEVKTPPAKQETRQ